MLADFREILDRMLLQDSAGKLTPAQRDDCLRRAVIQYSIIKPRGRVQIITGNGVAVTFALASDFEEGFSRLLAIEYPVGLADPEYLDAARYFTYRDATTGVLGLRLRDLTLPNTKTAYVSYTARHVVTEGAGTAAQDTVVPADRDPVCHLAAAMGFESLTAAYTQERDASILAEISRGVDQATGYLELARHHRRQFALMMGISRDAFVLAASAVQDLDLSLEAWGGPRFFHDSESR